MISGSFSAVANSLCNCVVIFAGSFAGPNTPYQLMLSIIAPGAPASAMVGTSGMKAARLGPV